MTILTLDIGFDNTGWAVIGKEKGIVDVGCITTSKSPKKTKVRVADENAMRAAQTAMQLAEIIRRHSCMAMIGEMPSGGALSAMAMRSMAIASSVASVTAALLEIPAEWCTPTDVKLATVGLKSATKDEVMEAVAKKYGWIIDEKSHSVMASKGKNAGISKQVTRKMFNVKCLSGTKKIPGGTFEHIADAIGASWAMAGSNLMRMYC